MLQPKFCTTCRSELKLEETKRYNAYTGEEHNNTIILVCPKYNSIYPYQHIRYQFMDVPKPGVWLPLDNV